MNDMRNNRERLTCKRIQCPKLTIAQSADFQEEYQRLLQHVICFSITLVGNISVYHPCGQEHSDILPTDMIVLLPIWRWWRPVAKPYPSADMAFCRHIASRRTCAIVRVTWQRAGAWAGHLETVNLEDGEAFLNWVNMAILNANSYPQTCLHQGDKYEITWYGFVAAHGHISPQAAYRTLALRTWADIATLWLIYLATNPY